MYAATPASRLEVLFDVLANEEFEPTVTLLSHAMHISQRASAPLLVASMAWRIAVRGCTPHTCRMEEGVMWSIAMAF
jgi:hypothetical protein